MTVQPGTVLIVVDLQNDFCTATRHQHNPDTLHAVTTNTARAIDTARTHGTEVVFVRFIGDLEHQPPSWRHRDATRGRPPKCREGTWGAQFHTVTPAPGERVFTKKACFDAFLHTDLHHHLTRRAAHHLVFAGLYTDVCVDTTARTAFQKGYHITILTDCTTALHLADDDILRFQRALYGARTTTHDHPHTWTRFTPDNTEPPSPTPHTASA
ncbi:hypothetical protein BLA60_29875 [Actinophytocola xinjiangensis]|uniref:Isochorismatase-like domain-containing protein n=1 Tax=Actinophytocola xinjiangensis TaxID=485602 RepID=A0A7Z0WJS4_9PSEU|nr:hypothetical protein BLA60_29875 [Actinophytocola xinjiangensis]